MIDDIFFFLSIFGALLDGKLGVNGFSWPLKFSMQIEWCLVTRMYDPRHMRGVRSLQIFLKPL